MSQKKVISTDELQFNPKPTKTLLTEKKRVVRNGQTPNTTGICSCCALDSPEFESSQILLHPELNPWGHLPMVPTTRNLTTPPTRRQKIGFHYCSSQWRNNESDGVSSHRRPDCLPNRLSRCRLKKTSKLRVTGSDRWIPLTKGQ